MSKLQVVSFEQKGELANIPLQEWRYKQQKQLFEAKHNKEVPDQCDFDWHDHTLRRMLLSDVEIRVEMSNKKIYTWNFEKGFIFDWLSIPRAARCTLQISR